MTVTNWSLCKQYGYIPEYILINSINNKVIKISFHVYVNNQNYKTNIHLILNSTRSLKMKYQRVHIDKNKIIEHPNLIRFLAGLLQPNMKLPYILTKTQNESKRAETTRNDPLKICKTTRNIKIGEICNFLVALLFQTSSPNDQIWVFFGQEISTVQSFNEILHVPYFKWTDFKSEIGFQKVWVQIPKFWHFGSKIINFLILTKFCMYPIPKMLISNLTLVFENFEHKCPNLCILVQQV